MNYHVAITNRGYAVRHIVSGYVLDVYRTLKQAENMCAKLNHK